MTAMLTIATPLRVEQRAVRAAVSASTRVVHCGMGERRSRAAAVDGRLDRFGPLAVLGLAGGLDPHLCPGDVVVATEVRDPDGRVVTACPSAPILEAALRRRGLPVHLGPIVSARTLVTDAERIRGLAATGASAVDMESCWLAPAGEGRPFAVVRVVSDTAAAPLRRLGALPRGARALRRLGEVAAAVEEWADACADREVRLASPRSFCAGVERAIDIVERALERYGAPVYVRRQIVHNAHVVADLERRGAIFVNELDEVPIGARAILAAHGVAPDVRAQAAQRRLSLIDATCPLVAKVHREVKRYAAADHTILLIGHADHEEVVGTSGEAPGRVRVVEDVEAAARVDVADPERVAYVMQTTLAVDEAERIAGVLRERFPRMRGPRQDDICYATSNRQQAVRDIAPGCDLLLVVGSRNSSNSLRLVEVASRAGAGQARLIDDASQLDPRWLHGARVVGVTAGASAPPALVDGVVAVLRGLGEIDVREHLSVTEDLVFTLPKEVS